MLNVYHSVKFFSNLSSLLAIFPANSDTLFFFSIHNSSVKYVSIVKPDSTRLNLKWIITSFQCTFLMFYFSRAQYVIITLFISACSITIFCNNFIFFIYVIIHLYFPPNISTSTFAIPTNDQQYFLYEYLLLALLWNAFKISIRLFDISHIATHPLYAIFYF